MMTYGAATSQDDFQPRPVPADTLPEHHRTPDTAPCVPGGTLTPKAAAVVLANLMYDEARESDNPAGTLDNICDNLTEVMPEVFRIVGTNPDAAELLLPLLADRMWAYNAIEYARTQIAHDYGYICDALADSLRAGTDPAPVRADALRIAEQFRKAGA
ncbi:hypothetical protein [Streptomyces sp. NPDC047024]|uniref:hypothetical protein n=1 Tax=Streptomyces sp. NPDC047024 TaxID=3155476 RepID=UPI0033C69C29